MYSIKIALDHHFVHLSMQRTHVMGSQNLLKIRYLAAQLSCLPTHHQCIYDSISVPYKLAP